MENKIDGKYLERIQIEGLWGRYDVDWRLHPDVNILVGENGTGKSTILRLATAGLKFFLLKKKVDFKNIVITVSEDKYKFDKLNPSMTLGGERGYSLKTLKDQQTTLSIDYIDTFEFYPSDNNGKEGNMSNLERQLDIVTREYLAYQSRQSSKVFTKKMTFEAAFAQKTYLFDTLNRLFSSTGKKVDEQEGELEFLIDETERIQRQDLSAGEKQLLIILLTVLCQEEKPAILLMDEPEISLHLRWQYELISILRTLNPNCQLVIATHSPSIFNDGWRDKVFWTEDIVQKAVPA